MTLSTNLYHKSVRNSSETANLLGFFSFLCLGLFGLRFRVLGLGLKVGFRV